MQVLQRTDWHGSPIDLSDVFILKKNGRESRCKLRTHQFGWELVLFVGCHAEIVQSQVCRSQDDVLTISAQWKAAMLVKGWL
jgi:hypothetical protein